MHAASVGEAAAAAPLVKQMQLLMPDAAFVLTAITPGGFESARASGLYHAVFFAPFDAPFCVRRAAAAIRAQLLVVMETEIWPNLLHCTKDTGCRVVIVNGRLSDRSYPRYLRLRPLFRWALSAVDQIFAQTQTDAYRFASIGASPEKTSVFGNIKFDQASRALTEPESAALRADFGLQPGPTLVIGSTRLASEEQLLIEAVCALKRRLPDLKIVHAPRHIERAAEVEHLWKTAGFAPVRRSQRAQHPCDVLILDTLGELADAYAVADVAFIGNSMTAPGGGQNLLQPLAQGRPVLFGPYMQNFRDLAAIAVEQEVGFPVSTPQEICAKAGDLMQDAEQLRRISARALQLVENNRGTARRIAQQLVSMSVPQ